MGRTQNYGSGTIKILIAHFCFAFSLGLASLNGHATRGSNAGAISNRATTRMMRRTNIRQNLPAQSPKNHCKKQARVGILARRQGGIGTKTGGCPKAGQWRAARSVLRVAVNRYLIEAA